MKVDNKNLENLKSLRFKSIWFIVFLLAVVVLSLFIIKSSIIRPKDQSKEVFNYKLENSINYRVLLYNNNFYEEKYLGMDKQYATDLVDNIEVNFINQFDISSSSIIEYDYEIIADINGIYTSDSSRKKTELWNRKFTIKEKTKGNTSRKRENTINEKIDIDFNYFNQIVLDFKKELRLNIDATLNIQMIINYEVKNSNETIKQNQILKVDIPLNKAAFEITTAVPDIVEDTIYENGDLIIHHFYLIIALIFLFIAIILLINFIRRLMVLDRKTEYAAALNKILRQYGEIIAASTTLPNYAKYDLLDITTFEDLVDIENELRVPIIYHEKVRDKEGWFLLIHGDQMYRYILRVTKR